MESKEKSPRFAVCIDNSGYAASLELNEIYAVVPDAGAAADGDLRIVDESGGLAVFSFAVHVNRRFQGAERAML